MVLEDVHTARKSTVEGTVNKSGHATMQAKAAKGSLAVSHLKYSPTPPGNKQSFSGLWHMLPQSLAASKQAP